MSPLERHVSAAACLLERRVLVFDRCACDAATDTDDAESRPAVHAELCSSVGNDFSEQARK